VADNQWFTPNFSSKSALDLRKNHVADLIGHQNAHALSMVPLKWSPLIISEFTPGPALACHASAVVLPTDIKYNQRTSLYKFPENAFGKIASNRVINVKYNFI